MAKNNLFRTTKRAANLAWINVLAMSVAANAAGVAPDACRLLSVAEIQNAIGLSVAGFKASFAFRGGAISLCQGRAGEMVVTIRVSEQSDQDDQNESIIEQMISEGGGKVETVRTGPAACTTIVPAPAMAAEYGFDSICSIRLNGVEVAVQAATHKQAAMAPVAGLRRLLMIAAQRINGSAR